MDADEMGDANGQKDVVRYTPLSSNPSTSITSLIARPVAVLVTNTMHPIPVAIARRGG